MGFKAVAIALLVVLAIGGLDTVTPDPFTEIWFEVAQAIATIAAVVVAKVSR